MNSATTGGSSASTGKRATYRNFDVRIGREANGEYPIEVLSSPAGEAQSISRLPISFEKLREMLRELRLPFTERSQIVDLGTALHQFLFVPSISLLWTTSLGTVRSVGEGLCLRLRFDHPNLTHLPWELIYDPFTASFLVPTLQTPLVRYLTQPTPADPINVDLPLRILLVVSSPADYPSVDAAREINWLNQALAPLRDKGLVRVDSLATATVHQLHAYLQRDYHILHYIGHGVTDSARAMSYLVLVDEVTQAGHLQDAETLHYLLQGTTIQLAFLNACQTALTSGAEAFLGLAQTLIKAGLPSVIAMQFDIPDTSAAIFARSFYGSLASEASVQTAVTEGRKAVMAHTGTDRKDWATPALFMRSPTGRLFAYRNQASTGRSEELHMASVADTDQLHQILITRFDKEELLTLCFYLNIDYDELGSGGKAAQARELIRYLQRRQQLNRLIEAVQRFRPDIIL